MEIDRTAATGWFDFVELGVKHILTGYDHLLFLVALLATARGLWSVVRIVTAFTLAHSITLTLGALGIVSIPDRIIEPLIAATIVWVALENLVVAEPDRKRWIWSFGFGLVHGLGFASALTELGLKGAEGLQLDVRKVTIRRGEVEVATVERVPKVAEKPLVKPGPQDRPFDPLPGLVRRAPRGLTG